MPVEPGALPVIAHVAGHHLPALARETFGDHPPVAGRAKEAMGNQKGGVAGTVAGGLRIQHAPSYPRPGRGIQSH